MRYTEKPVTLLKKENRRAVLHFALQCGALLLKGGAYYGNKNSKCNSKESAEAILEKLGIPVSVFIDMTYRQVIANNGIPFALNLPKTIETRDELSDAQFNSMMEKGLLQAKANESKPAKEVFANLRKRI